MARQRMHKPELISHVPFLECSVIGRLLFIQLQNFCDDYGNHPFSVRAIKAEVFPADDFTVTQIEGLVDELIKKGLLVKYSAGNQQYLHVLGWENEGHPCYQTINKAQPSTHPKYDEFVTTGTLPEQSGLRQDKIIEDKIKENNVSEPEPPASVVDPSAALTENFSETKKPSYPELFLKLWDGWFGECVNKGSKPQAHVKWLTLTKKNPGLAQEMILQLEQQKQQFVLCKKYGVWVAGPRQLVVWLNQSGWTDEVKTEEQIRGVAPAPKPGVTHLRGALPLTAEQEASAAKKRQEEQEGRDKFERERETLYRVQYPEIFAQYPLSIAINKINSLENDKIQQRSTA